MGKMTKLKITPNFNVFNKLAKVKTQDGKDSKDDSEDGSTHEVFSFWTNNIVYGKGNLWNFVQLALVAIVLYINFKKSILLLTNNCIFCSHRNRILLKVSYIIDPVRQNGITTLQF